MICLCNDWEFTEQWSGAFARGEGEAAQVRLPHSLRELPLHYAQPEQYEAVCGYRRKLYLGDSLRGKKLLLRFAGAAHTATVFLNGAELLVHGCGYTAFTVDIGDAARFGAENLLAVKLDSRESQDLPPFGFAIDYLTYSGLYREVYLDVREPEYLEDVFLYTPGTKELRLRVRSSVSGGSLRVSVWGGQGEELCCTAENDGSELCLSTADFRNGCRLWSVEEPNLYLCRVQLLRRDGSVADTVEKEFGVRCAEFRGGDFYLNGEKLFLRGLNRHQSYPYLGYAAPERLQREDARILKEELGCNMVRTSHYPQSEHFISQCDRLGLLVFTEIPGWQHIGGEEWKKQALQNVREMVEQYRSHPSIVLWGVRINESPDDDGLYTATNALAHELDPSRATSGVRYLEKSHLLEDVYAYNDFSHTGSNAGVRPKKKVTPDPAKPLIISEHNGHMFPTKACDPWEKRQEQALRHARVVDDAMADGGHAGVLGWCMFDYPTHEDFGSGDRICYHGVMDAFRNPKTAAAFYASQQEKHPVLELGSSMDIGDYAAGQPGKIYAFTNAEEVALYKDGKFVSSFRPKDWKALPHGPICIDDTIGQLLESEEGFSKEKAEKLRKSLTAAAKYGLANLPLGDKLRMARCMLQYKMSFEDGYALYGKYVSNWGGKAPVWRVDAKKGGEVIASRTLAPGKQLHLELQPCTDTLVDGDCWDAAAVRVRIADENGNTAVYAQLPVSFQLSGAAALVGPAAAAAEGGMTGTYVRSIGEAGRAVLTVSAPGLKAASVAFTIRRREELPVQLCTELNSGEQYRESFRLQPGRNSIRVALPQGQLRSLCGSLNWPMEPEERIFLNGFQTWTHCPEYRAGDKIRSLRHLPKPLVEHYGLERYGDYYFTPYPEKKGVTHGVSWCYFRKGDRFRLLASLDERPGYTLFCYDAEKQRLTLQRDCEGIRCGGEYPAFDLFWAEGTEDEVFDAWFREMGIQPRTREPIAGYSSWYNRYQNISEADIRKDLQACAGILEPGDVFQIDDGWECAVGDWLSPDFFKFGHGMEAAAREIHEAGYRAGLWLAPFVCQKSSLIYKQHPDWLLQHEGKPWYCGCNWGGFYSLDIDHPQVQDYLRRVFDTVLRVWEFDLVKLDFLYGAAPFGTETETRAGRMIRAMELLREWCGDKLILGCGVPVMPAFGLVDYCRVSCDVGLDWNDTKLMQQIHRERVSTKQAMENSIFRRQLNGRAYLSDPDVFFLRDSNLKLNEKQKQLLANVCSLFGGVLFTSDDMTEYDEEKKQQYALLRRNRRAEKLRVENDGEKTVIRWELEGEPHSLTLEE